MTRLLLQRFEGPARELCVARGKDPDEPTFFHNGEEKRPRWLDFAEQLRNHYERDMALEKAGL